MASLMQESPTMTDTRNDISLPRIEAMLANTAVPANFESAMQMLVELKDYFSRLSALRANAGPGVSATCADDASPYHELDA